MRNGVLIINTLVISIALVLSGFIIKPYLEEASNQYLSQKRSIVVKGLAEKEVKANIASFTFSFGYRNTDKQGLWFSLKNAKNDIEEYFIKNGIKADEISYITSSAGANTYEKDELGFYNSHIFGRIDSSNFEAIKKVQENINQMYDKGHILELSEPTYLYTELGTIKDEMLGEAVKNAYKAGNEFVSESGSKIGSLKKANQGLFSINDSNDPKTKVVRVVSTVEYLID
ncbi:MAG: SIMPL domain-containing protein [Ruminobacter sp.]|nr:SIMPL domain-containing protein [Ruminobacter sp.]